MRKKRKNFPPSRQRYEQANPVLSVRVPRVLYDELKALRERSGKSIGDVLWESLGLQKASAKAAYSRGYNKGWAEAEAKYRVDYRCKVCGGTLSIATDNEKKAAATCMREAGWGHVACHNKQA